ncbi:MAG: DEAD/DEAH box helicase [Rikenellaceae bacterium]
MAGFEKLGISDILINKLQNIEVTEPTPIQQLVIPHAVKSESILAQSQTGSGKTLAYLLPIVERLDNNNNKRALIVAPTRELVQQIDEVCGKLSSSIKRAVIYGGVEYESQREMLRENPQIIISTVGRLLDLIDQDVANVEEIDFFVLDEVDQMVDLGFRDGILRLSKYRASNAQTLCFSATLPVEVEGIISEIMPSEIFRAHVNTESLAVERIEQSGYYVSTEMMDHLLIHILKSDPPRKGVIFTRSRKMADRLSLLLRERDIFTEAMHSDRSQVAREHILERFKSGDTTLLVATDVIARGIDIDDIDVVYNYGLPLEAEQYIHRIGRTARGGKSGHAINISTPQEKPLVDKVCKLMRRNITMTTAHPYATPDVVKALQKPTSAVSTQKKDKKRGKK